MDSEERTEFEPPGAPPSGATSLDDDQTEAEEGTGAAPNLASGDFVGRYVVRRQLGEGAMGVVFEAYDPELDRAVAIKLLRTRKGKKQKATQERLLREAQALARLSHPNVIPVYDVGESDGRVFVAMELAENATTLREWNSGDGHPWEETLDVFCAAGHGLAAAHRADLIHRDFKPDNVLIDGRGRVRVMDFGLARGARTTEMEVVDSLEAVDSLSQTLTRTGAVMGTPGYMSPEQHFGQEVDEKADQFAFCVALFEGMFGKRPFKGRTVKEIAHSKWYGRVVAVEDAPRGADVPEWVRAAIMRGLKRDPLDRWPSMRALLRALRHSRKRRPWPWLAIGGGVAVAATVGVALWPSANPCRSAKSQLRGIWDRSAKARLNTAFEATELKHAGYGASKASDRLDEYADQWKASWKDVCNAVTDDEAQSMLVDRQMHCLGRRRDEFSALVDVLVQADRTTVEHAAEAVASLPPVSNCLDPRYEEGPAPPPGLAVAVDATDQMIDIAKAHDRAGKTRAGLTYSTAALAAAIPIGHPPLTVRARTQVGSMQRRIGFVDEALANYEEAVWEAERAGLDVAAARAAAHLVFALTNDAEKHDEAFKWARHARSLLERGERNEYIEAQLDQNEASVLQELRRNGEAEALLRKAVAARERLQGDHPNTAMALNNLGTLLSATGRYEEALAAHERALEIRRRVQGPEHPEFAMSLINIGGTRSKRGEYKEAMPHLERALGIFDHAYGPDHNMTVQTQTTIGATLLYTGEAEKALPILEEVLAHHERVYGKHDPRVAGALMNLAAVYSEQERYSESRNLLARALAMVPPDSEDAAGFHYNLGHLEFEEKHFDVAEAELNTALELWKKHLGEKHPTLGYAYGKLGALDIERGQFHDAVQKIELAIELRRGQFSGARYAQDEFHLARALWETGAHVRAEALARAARQSLLTGGTPYADDVLEVDAWLAATIDKPSG